MANGFSRTPKLLKGALIRFDAPLLIPIPNIIIFQYNPETVSRTLTPYAPPGRESAGSEGASNPDLTQPFDPQESFSLKLEIDAADALESPEFHPVAVVAGVADRLAAMEMLLYPVTEGVDLLGSVSVSLSAGGASLDMGGAAGSAVPDKKVPITLFFWGPGRIVPVRLTSFTVEEQQFSPLLYPTRATVSVGLSVLTPSAILNGREEDSLGMIEKLAMGAYQFTMVQKQLLATANLANSVESIINMLPI